jgi:hypothetical protein
MRKPLLWAAVAASLLLVTSKPAFSADLTEGMKKGDVGLQSASALAFGPQGILFIGDARAASIVAIATGETSGDPEKADYNLEGIDKRVAAALGTEARDILINDLAVNPASGTAYLAVSRGRGPDATVVLLRVDGQGKISEVALEGAMFSKAALPNAPADSETGRVNPRTLAITDLEYVDGRVLVAGLSNEEFASTLRSIPFPFSDINRGAGVEIFHGAHGRFETQSPVRTFTSYAIGGEPHVLAAYTCTPLVKFPLEQLTPGAKVRGVTVAELGNRNQPLDMFIYQKDGKDYILLANSRRGVMRITTEDIQRDKGITERIAETAGQTYDTIEGWTGIVQLERLNSKQVLLLSQTEAGDTKLFSAPLP